jgi:outer membrane protein OmpA-like peptidoglycan-associated protein
MIDSETYSTRDVNIWISFADVFAGLLLITIVGLVVLAKQREDENVKFSKELVRVMNHATDMTTKLKSKLDPLLKNISSQTQYSETQIVIPAGALFASCGYDDYRNDAEKLKLLTAIRDALKDTLDQAVDERKFLRITIEGHTDNVVIGAGRCGLDIPTNWELSSRRATGVLRFFEEAGLSAQAYNIMAMGLADTRPVGPNTTDEQRKRNRRIEIKIEPDIDKLRRSL